MEEIAVAAIDFGVGIGVGALLNTLAPALGSFIGITIPGGIIGLAAIPIIGVYQSWIKPEVEELLEETQDNFEQELWKNSALNEVHASEDISSWDVFWNVKV